MELVHQTSFNSNVADAQRLSMKQPPIDVLSNRSYPWYLLYTFFFLNRNCIPLFYLCVDSIARCVPADGTGGDYTTELIGNDAEMQMVAVSGDPMLP